ATGAKVAAPPDHAGSTKIEAGVAVANAVLERVRGPESLGIEMLEGIRHDVLDRGFGLALVPGDRPQWHVTRRLVHAPTIARQQERVRYWGLSPISFRARRTSPALPY